MWLLGEVAKELVRRFGGLSSSLGEVIWVMPPILSAAFGCGCGFWVRV